LQWLKNNGRRFTVIEILQVDNTYLFMSAKHYIQMRYDLVGYQLQQYDSTVIKFAGKNFGSGKTRPFWSIWPSSRAVVSKKKTKYLIAF
jgi:hypothetical protein